MTNPKTQIHMKNILFNKKYSRFIFTAFLLFVFVPQVCFGAVALVNSTHMESNSDSPPATTSTIDSTGATLLVVWTSQYNYNSATQSTISDSKGNNWHAVANYGSGGLPNGAFWYAYDSGSGAALQVGTGHTVTINTHFWIGALTFAAFSGTLT